MSKRPKKMDLNQLAKRIVDKATGEIQPEETDEKKKAANKKKRLNKSESSNNELDS